VRAIQSALDEYTARCEVLGGVDAAFSSSNYGTGGMFDGGDEEEEEAVAEAVDAARVLAASLAAWARDVPATSDGRSAVFDTWAARRRRRMCQFVSERVLADAADDDEDEDGAVLLPVPTRDDARLLASLAREVVKSADAAARLADAPSVAATKTRGGDTDGGVVGAAGGGSGSSGGEVTYPRCFLLYNTLMFFIFKVKVKRRERGGWPGLGNAPFT
jgi:hypothetical protein